jgi:hypothetical protein
VKRYYSELQEDMKKMEPTTRDEIGACDVTRMSLDLGLGLVGLKITFPPTK